MKTLSDFYKSHTGKVSDKWASYLNVYDRIFAPYRQQPISLLEIGVQNGGSLEIWSQYFSFAQKLIGCDINLDCAKLRYENERISVVVGDATTEEAREKIIHLASSFDIVIEDGSHTSKDIVKAFENYFPLLNNDGVFVAEDLHCSYWQEFEGGIFYPYSSMSFFKFLADVVNYEHWGVQKCRQELISGFKNKYACDISEQLLSEIHSVEFYNSICVIRRKSSELNVLGERRVTGSEELVVGGLLNRGTQNETIQQNNNYWSNLMTPPAESHLYLMKQIEEYKLAAISAQDVSRQLREDCLVEQAKLVNLQAVLDVEQAESQRLRSELCVQQAESKRLHDELCAQQLVAQDLQDRTIVQQADIQHLNEIVHAVHSSRSWRYTELLRKSLAVARVPVNFVKKTHQKSKRMGGYIGLLKRTKSVIMKEGIDSLIWRVNEVESQPHVCGISMEESASGSNSYHDWVMRYDTHDSKSIQRLKQAIGEFSCKPKISVIMPVYNTPLIFLEQAIQSVINQIYENWELCISDDASTDSKIRPFLEEYRKKDARIRIIFREENGHISKSSNSALDLATGEYAALFDHDDLLKVDALFWIADAINRHPDVTLIYSDEDKIDGNGVRCEPFFKPDWSPHLALSQAYLGHLVVFDIKFQKPRFSDECVGAQDYDLWLSLSAGLKRDEIVHVPRILYHWRKHQNSTAENPESKIYADDSGLRAVSKYVANRYPAVKHVAKKGQYLFTYACEFDFSDDQFVSIIIPTKDRVDLLSECIDSILSKTNFKKYEVIVLNNNSVERSTFDYFNRVQLLHKNLKVVDANIDFNWSKLNNIGVANASGNVYVFLNNDTSVISPDWLSYLVGYANLPDVGVVGGLLLFEDGSIQHSGVVVGMGGWADHVYRTMPPIHTSGTGFVSPVMTRNVLAVTGACMALAKNKFDVIGGFDENFVICGSDVEMCIRSHNYGFYNVMCGEVRLFHYESKTRSSFVPGVDFEQSSMKYEPYRTLITDPFYNRNLSLDTTHPSIEGAPRDL